MVSPTLIAHTGGASNPSETSPDLRALMEELNAHLGSFGAFFKAKLLKLVPKRDDTLIKLAVTKTNLQAALTREKSLESELGGLR